MAYAMQEAETPKRVLLITGARASFKSTQSELIGICAHSRHVCAMDTSQAIKFSVQYKTPFGRQLSPLLHLAEEGELLPPELVFGSVFEYVRNWQTVHGPMHDLVLAGSSRSVEESQLWLKLRKPIKIVRLLNEFTDVVHWASKRQQQGVERKDMTMKSLERSWEVNLESIIPGVEVFKNHGKRIGQDLTLELQSSMDPQERTKRILDFMHAEPGDRKVWRRRLKDPNHHVHRLISKIRMPIGSTAPPPVTAKEHFLTPA